MSLQHSHHYLIADRTLELEDGMVAIRRTGCCCCPRWSRGGGLCVFGLIRRFCKTSHALRPIRLWKCTTMWTSRTNRDAELPFARYPTCATGRNTREIRTATGDDRASAVHARWRG